MVRLFVGLSLLSAFAHGVALMGYEPPPADRSSDMSFGKEMTDAPPASSAGGKKYMFASIHTTLGFGDKMRWYYDQLVLAKLLGRVLILPEMFWGRTSYNEMADTDPSELLEAVAQGQTAIRAWQKKHCNGPCKTRYRFFPGDSLFDTEALSKYHEVISFQEWQRTDGHIDVMLVPGNNSFTGGCLPNWVRHCQDRTASEKVSGRKFLKWGKELTASKVLCTSTDEIEISSGNNLSPYDEGQISCSKSEKLKSMLSQWDSVRTIGLDGFCSSTSIFAVCESQNKVPEVWGPVRAAFRFRRDLLVESAKLVRKAGLKGKKFLSVHWRHSDIAVGTSYSRIGTYSAKVLVYHIKKLTEENPHLKALLPELDAVYLASDNFFKQNIADFKHEINRVFGWDTVRFQSDDWVHDTAMDLVMCSKSDFFISTYPGSFFSRFIEEERDLRKKHWKSHYSTPADVFKKRAIDMEGDIEWRGSNNSGEL